MRSSPLVCLLLLLGTTPAFADAAADIDQANHDWSTGMVRSDAALVANAYAADAVFCDAKGTCTTGHDAIEKLMADRLKAGPARSAAAHSTRRIADGGFIYEWGSAQLVNAAGQEVSGRYFAVWVERSGRWKIFRNLVLP